MGGFNPHKRVDAIVGAHGALATSLGDERPTCCSSGPTSEDVFHSELKALRALGAGPRVEPLVHWTGFVADEELRHLHSGALAVLLPSACEGFGLPAVEAAACGAPVIATTESPLPELLEGGGIFVRPGDDETLYTAMLMLVRDPERRRASGTRARARRTAQLARGRAQRLGRTGRGGRVRALRFCMLTTFYPP